MKPFPSSKKLDNAVELRLPLWSYVILPAHLPLHTVITVKVSYSKMFSYNKAVVLLRIFMAMLQIIKTVTASFPCIIGAAESFPCTVGTATNLPCNIGAAESFPHVIGAAMNFPHALYSTDNTGG